MASYPVSFEVHRPESHQRFQVVVRLLVIALLALAGMSLGWTFFVLLLILPAYAAVQSSVKGGARFLVEDGPGVTRVLRWVMAFYAYLALLTDKLPDSHYAENVEFAVDVEGNPTPSSALWRLVASLPGLFYLAVIGFVSGILWIVAMAMVALTGVYPESAFQMQLGIYRYMARLLAYHASLVDQYPPFTIRAEEHPGDDLGHPHAV